MTFRKTLIGASGALALGRLGVAATVQSAAAHVICNSDCWSTQSAYKYPAELDVTVYSDRYADQAYRDSEWRELNRTWRVERHDRGYYKGGVWIQF